MVSPLSSIAPEKWATSPTSGEIAKSTITVWKMERRKRKTLFSNLCSYHHILMSFTLGTVVPVTLINYCLTSPLASAYRQMFIHAPIQRRNVQELRK